MPRERLGQPRHVSEIRTPAHSTVSGPIQLSTTGHMDVDSDQPHREETRKRHHGQAPAPTVGRSARPAHSTSIRSARAKRAHAVIEQASAQRGLTQLSLFAEAPSMREKQANSVHIDEIRLLRGYLASRVDERGLPREDSALVDADSGVDYGRLMRMVRRLADLEQTRK